VKCLRALRANGFSVHCAVRSSGLHVLADVQVCGCADLRRIFGTALPKLRREV